MPIIPVLVLGFVMNTDVKHLPTIVFDQSLQQEGRDLLSSFEASEYFDVKYVAKSNQDVNDAIAQGKAKVGIIIPPDLTDNVKHNRSTVLQVIVDATESSAASSAASAAQQIGQIKSQEILAKRGDKAEMPYDIRIRAWYNPDFVSAYYKVTDAIGAILTITMVLFTSMTIIHEREWGTMEYLIVTPLKSWELIVGKIMPYTLIGYIQATVSLLVGTLAFDLPLCGSIALFYVLSSLYIFASLSLGILISTIAKTKLQALLLSIGVIYSSLLLSGFMVPRAAMPLFFQTLGNLIPLTFYLEILRGVLLKGTSIKFLWSQILTLMILSAAFLTASILKFQKKII